MKIFINIIENEISNIITYTYTNYISNKKLEKVISKKNNKILINYINELSENTIKIVNIKKITNIINLKENIKKILEFIKLYQLYYILLFISYYYKISDYNNIIVNLQKNNILLPDANNNTKKILNLYNFITQLKYVINNLNNETTFNKIKYNNNYTDTIKFINDNINNDNLSYYLGNNINNYNNIIFLTLIKYNYVKNDVKYIYNLLDDNTTKIYKYIDIVVPILNIVDKNSIELALNINNKRPDLINDIFKLLKFEKKVLTDKEKINIIMKQNLIYPILEDFMRYNKTIEKYDKKNTAKFDKNNTKMKYIISNITEVQNYKIKSEQEKNKIDQLFYKRLEYRDAILFNNLEEINIIRKLF